MRVAVTELLADMGLGWGTAGIGTLALLALSPKGRKRARSMLVRTIATGLTLKDQISNAGSGLMQEINQAVSDAQQPSAQVQPNPIELV